MYSDPDVASISIEGAQIEYFTSFHGMKQIRKTKNITETVQNL